VQQLRVQVESQTLKEEIKEDLRERVEGVKQIGEEVSNTLAGMRPLLL
jgi:Fe-S cluster biogenesis protein NfuA